jgi:hypothetical protein
LRHHRNDHGAVGVFRNATIHSNPTSCQGYRDGAATVGIETLAFAEVTASGGRPAPSAATYVTLPAAQERAHQHGYKGAMYPWESDPFNGTDQTPFFAHENAQREIHINGDVAIAQWQYYLATQDREWLREYGYPVIRATADFWVSRVVYQKTADRYEILHVTSPDEAYNDVSNDSFTIQLPAETCSLPPWLQAQWTRLQIPPGLR